jgi:hypothetical protein
MRLVPGGDGGPPLLLGALARGAQVAGPTEVALGSLLHRK